MVGSDFANRHRVTSALLLSLFLAALFPPALQAADSAPAIKVLSWSIKPEELPAPGAPMILKARVTNSKALDRIVRAMIVRDGRLVEVPMIKSYLNEDDLATFEFQVTAPLAELTYKFVAYDNERPAFASPQYVVRRRCMPALELTDPRISSESPDSQIVETFTKASALGDEIEHYENARKHLDALQALLGP
jgi:hypothetical protein